MQHRLKSLVDQLGTLPEIELLAQTEQLGEIAESTGDIHESIVRFIVVGLIHTEIGNREARRVGENPSAGRKLDVNIPEEVAADIERAAGWLGMSLEDGLPAYAWGKLCRYTDTGEIEDVIRAMCDQQRRQPPPE